MGTNPAARKKDKTRAEVTKIIVKRHWIPTGLLILALACCAGCRPRSKVVVGSKDPSPPIARIDSFAENEVRLKVVANSAKVLKVQVGLEHQAIDLSQAGEQGLRLVFKATDNGFTVTNPEGTIAKSFTSLGKVEFLTPPFSSDRAVVMGTCDGPRTIRLEVTGPTGRICCEAPPLQSGRGDLTSYKITHLPAMRDVAAAIDDVRERTRSTDYDLIMPSRKPAGRNFRGQAFWALTTWPPNASECVTYMVTVSLPKNQERIWQVFVIDPDTGEISLIRDRRTGELISLSDWLRLEEMTAVYTLDEMLQGVVDHFNDQAAARHDAFGRGCRFPDPPQQNSKKKKPNEREHHRQSHRLGLSRDWTVDRSGLLHHQPYAALRKG